jgi:ribosomal protein L11 methyltransferase
MCLRAIEEARPPESWSFLDVGTGSGILAIYAAMLGAGEILAIDIDPEALRWAKRNLELNDLQGAVELSSEKLESLRGEFRVVTANLTLNIIEELLPYFPGLIRPGGWLILSGILGEQAAELEIRLAGTDLEQERLLYQDEWACLTARRTK